MAAVAERPPRDRMPRLRWVGRTAGQKMLDRQARKLLGISGDEFLRRWDSGEYRAIADDPDHPEIRRLAMLIPFAR